jgi:hypothetical protein
MDYQMASLIKKVVCSALICQLARLTGASAQDSTRTRQLKELQIKDKKSDVNGLRRLADVENMAVYAGKKNEVIVLQGLNANLATNNARQIYSKVPGVNIVENDSYGIQLGVATRGLNPNRTTEFNSGKTVTTFQLTRLAIPKVTIRRLRRQSAALKLSGALHHFNMAPSLEDCLIFSLKKEILTKK